MIITCPQCNVSRDVGDVRIPHRGAMATCPGCGAQFMLKPDRPPRSEHQLVRSCPSCSYAHPPGDMSGTCPQCGLVYERFLKRQQRIEEMPPIPPADSAAPDTRETAGGWRRLLRNRILLGIAAVALVAICLKYGHDWKLDKEYRLIPSAWQGEMTYRGKKHPFVLVIESAADGKLGGYMDWVGFSPRYRLAVRGSYTGNHLIFEDYAFLEGKGTYGLNDRKDVYIEENVMNGSDKNGNAELHAIKLESLPM